MHGNPRYTTLGEIADALRRWETDRGHRDPEIRASWEALSTWQEEVQTATAEAAALWAVVRNEQASIRTMEVALARSPTRCCEVLPSCREARGAVAQRLGARKAELSRWQTRLTHLTATRCELLEAECALVLPLPPFLPPYLSVLDAPNQSLAGGVCGGVVSLRLSETTHSARTSSRSTA